MKFLLVSSLPSPNDLVALKLQTEVRVKCVICTYDEFLMSLMYNFQCLHECGELFTTQTRQNHHIKESASF